MRSNKNKAFDTLRRNNPVHESDLPGPDSPQAEELLARIIATPPTVEVRVGGSRGRLRLVVVLAAILVVTVAATWIWVQSITHPQAVICHEAVDLGSDMAGAPASETATADACIPVWEDETLVNPDIVPPGSVPPLTACVGETGALVVLPTDDTSICSRLGLARPDPATQATADQIRQLQTRLIEYFQSADCIPIDEATNQVRLIADAHGMSDWEVQPQEPTPERPCGSLSLDPENETISIVPIPRP